jgi:hypothetical protein
LDGGGTEVQSCIQWPHAVKTRNNCTAVGTCTAVGIAAAGCSAWAEVDAAMHVIWSPLAAQLYWTHMSRSTNTPSPQAQMGAYPDA